MVPSPHLFHTHLLPDHFPYIVPRRSGECGREFMRAVPRPDIRTHFHFMTRTCQTRRLLVDVQCRSGTGHIEVQSRRPFPLAFCPFPGAYVPKTIYHRVRKDFGGLSLRRTAKRGPAEIISKTPLLTTNNAARYVSCDKKLSISSSSLELLPGNSNYARISRSSPIRARVSMNHAAA